MTTHLGITEQLSTRELNTDALAQSRYLYIEGYLVTSPTAFDAAKQAQDIAQKNGCLVSVTLSDPAMVENFSGAFDELAGRGLDLIFCNEDEARLWTGASSREEAMTRLKERVRCVAMTCGKDGALVYDGSTVSMVPGVPTKAVDTTGAGDMFAGAFLYAINTGASFADAAALARLGRHCPAH